MKIYQAVKDFDDEIKKGSLVYVEPLISPVNTVFYALRTVNKTNCRGESHWKQELDKKALDLFFRRVIE